MVPKEKRRKIDAHGLTKEQVAYELDVILDYDYDVEMVVVVHGYKLGETLLKYVRNEYTHKRIIKKAVTANPGITLIYIQNDPVK